MGLFSIFSQKPNSGSSGNNTGGLIGYLNLWDFYNSLTEEEKGTLRHYYDSRLTTAPVNHRASTYDSGTIASTSETRLVYFSSTIGWAVSDKRYDIADKLIYFGEQYINEGLIDAHFFLQAAAECYYKQRDIRDDALDLCIRYCQRDVELFPRYRVPMEKEYGEIPRITTFQKLAVIYEKQKMYDKALEICQMALSYGLTDSTKGGYAGRIEKIQKKIGKG